jgi:DNA-nicking Smr family endonuclease
MSPRRPKHLQGEDRELWRRVTETVKPLHKSAPAPRSEPEPSVEPEKPAKKKRSAQTLPAFVTRPSQPKPAPSLAPIDKKLTRRIGRGSREVDAKIDLHGLTQREAHARLLSFLQMARARGDRLVLVVTGKGRTEGAAEWWEEGTRGVLRRSVPEWLATPPFRMMVVGFERAHARKGGDGALYVQLRRTDKPAGEER